MKIDHVIYATSDLDRAAKRMEDELGLAVAGGGRHVGIGTENRIVPLGNGYIELLTIADPEEAAGSDLARAVQRRIDATGDALMGWAVVVDDAEAVAKRLGVGLSTIAREGLSAQLAGLEEAMREPCLPFFISRDHGIPDPGAGRPGDGISWIEVAGDEARVREWLGGQDLPVQVVPGEPGVNAVGIGTRELRTA